MNKFLFIGDPHFKVNNAAVNDLFCEKCLKVAEANPDAIIVIGGDILDTHERIHQTPYNRAVKFIDDLRQINKVYLLVGNHDYENNNQFLNDNHWMNPLKKWQNVVVVDRVVEESECFFVPYVPVGRFFEALDTNSADWRNAKCIFAHQEFRGCKLGMLISENGDKWPLHYPLVISGHIHKPHSPQKNIIYPGSVIQQNFGEVNNDCGVMLIDLQKQKFEKIPIEVPKLQVITIDCSDFEKTINALVIKPHQKYKVICKGVEENFRRIRKTNLYNSLPMGVTICFKENIQEDKSTSGDELNFKVFFDELQMCIEKRSNAKELKKLLNELM